MNLLKKRWQGLRRRWLLLVLPFPLLLAAALLYWSLGGGRLAEPAPAPGGLDLSLPEAKLAAGLAAGKLAYYRQAAADSARPQQEPWGSLPGEDLASEGKLAASPFGAGTFPDTLQEAVHRKLGQVQTALQQESTFPAAVPVPRGLSRESAAVTGADPLALARQGMQPGAGPDPEMQQLDGMLEKILDIQHPERVREKRKPATAAAGAVLAVEAGAPLPVSTLAATQPAPSFGQSGFYAWTEAPAPEPSLLPAVVHGTQQVVKGATVKLRLTGEAAVGGRRVPSGSFLYGTARLEGERLHLAITHLRLGQSLLPVSLAVYDLDGQAGIYIPGGSLPPDQDQAAEQLVQDLSLPSVRPSLGARAAQAGVEAARSLFQKKTRQVRVTVKGDYQVLLRDETQL